jgi:hypothetical protein
LTLAHRDRAWAVVDEEVASTIRSVQELKRKFSDLKTRTKRLANNLFREAEKTEGGQNTAEKLSSSEQPLCAFIGKQSIEGNFDLNNNTQIKNYFLLGISERFDIGIPNYSQQPAATSRSSGEHETILQPPSPFGKETCENHHSVNKKTNPGPSSSFGEEK